MAFSKLKVRPSPDWILEQKRNGRSYRDIGRELGCSYQYVQQVLMSQAGTRQELIDKYGTVCSNCGSNKRISFHHQGYLTHDVLPLCNRCHMTLHSSEQWKWSNNRNVMHVGHLIYLGHTHKTTAEKIGISIKTVEKHAGNLYRQFNVNSIVMLVRMWHRHGLAVLCEKLNMG